MKKNSKRHKPAPHPGEANLPGQRHTKQRALVHQIIHSARGPLTVPEIHQLALQDMPRTGIATIYRTVKLLLDAGRIQSVIMPSGETRFESATLGHHHHFQCNTCGEVFDVDHCPMELQADAELPGGFVLQGHEITMYGLCPHCRKPAPGSTARV